MSTRRPEVFISATSADLRSCRQVIKEALLTLGCVPVEQTNFPPDYRSVRDMLRVKIAACDAVVHLAGNHYGAEPKERAPGEPRRSYTQMEYDLARELKKPLYVFVCGDDFAYDEHAPEDAEKRALQQAHRSALLGSETLRYKVLSRDDLALKIHALQTSVEHLAGELRKSRRHLARGVAIGLAAIVVLAGGIWQVSRRGTKTEEKVAKLETELDRQRRYIQSVADAYTQQQAELDKLKLTDEQKFERAVASVAQKEGVPEAQLRAGINLFVAAVKNDATASFMDRALAEFAQKNFSAAASNAGQAGAAAREQRLAARQLATQAEAAAVEASRREREAFSLQGKSLYAQKKYGDAVAAFENAADAAPRASAPRDWAEVQRHLAKALDDWADRSEGAAIAQRRERAIAGFRRVLEIFTPQETPDEWAFAQNYLGNALWQKARQTIDPGGLLDEAAAAYEAALTVRTREARPADWSITQNNRAGVALERGQLAVEPARSRFLAESLARFRDALTGRDPVKQPDGWAGLQGNIGIVLDRQADDAVEPRRAQLRSEAMAAFQAALGVVGPDKFAETWADVHTSLASTLTSRGWETGGDERKRAWQAAIESYQAALKIYTRATHPQEWAEAKEALADALDNTITNASVAERARVRDDVIAIYRESAQVNTREFLPLEWASTQESLAALFRASALDQGGAERARLLADAEKAARGALEVYPREVRPLSWAGALGTLADILADRGYDASGDERLALRAEVVAARRNVLTVHTRSGMPKLWAAAQIALADALDDQAEDFDEPRRSQLHGESIAACRAALEFYTRESLPLDWAYATGRLANILPRHRDGWTGDDERKAQLETVALRRSVLDVYTRSAFPEDWAQAKLNLAGALLTQGNRFSKWVERGPVFTEAAAACRSALEVYTRDAWPLKWANAQLQLAGSLGGLAVTASDGEKVSLRREEVAARRLALSVYTREEFAQRWAMEQVNLGRALLNLANTVEEAEGHALATEGFAAVRSALAVQTRAELPFEWAETQMDVAALLATRAEKVSDPARGRELYRQAVAARELAAEVYTRAVRPRKWVANISQLGHLMGELAGLSEGDEALKLIDRRIAYYREAMGYFTEIAARSDLGYFHGLVGEALEQKASEAGDAAHDRWLVAAIAEYRAGLTAGEPSPSAQRRLQQKLADAMRARADRAQGAERTRLLHEAVEAFRATLPLLDRSEPLGWSLYRSRLSWALIDYALALEPGKRAPFLREAIAAAREGLEAREASVINAALNELHLGRALWENAATLRGEERVAQLREARDALPKGIAELKKLKGSDAADLARLGDETLKKVAEALE